MIGHYTTWALNVQGDPASRIRTGDIAVAAQFARERRPYYSRALYQSELRRVSALIMLDRVVIKYFARFAETGRTRTLFFIYNLE